MLKAGFVSLGCSKNRVDTEIMLGILNKNNKEWSHTKHVRKIEICDV